MSGLSDLDRELHEARDAMFAAYGAGDAVGARAPFRGRARTAERTPSRIQVETWDEFTALAGEEAPMLVDGLVGAGGLGFIAGAPKSGKTWLACSLAVAVASGRPFLGRWSVPTPRPVLYVALEGTRHALATRFQVVARGAAVDLSAVPLHLAYKPRGLNLSDAGWGEDLTAAAELVDAGLVVVDVLRRGARIRESGEGSQDFAAMLGNLSGLDQAGRTLLICHHFRKPGGDFGRGDAGDLLAGSGAQRGALDCALYVTKTTSTEQTGRLTYELTVEHEARDFRAAAPFDACLSGVASGGEGSWQPSDTVLTTVQNHRPQREQEILEQQLRELLEGDGALTQAKAAGLLGTTRHRASFQAAWAAVRDDGGPS